RKRRCGNTRTTNLYSYISSNLALLQHAHEASFQTSSLSCNIHPLAHSLRTRKASCVFVSFISQKGGTGKTTLALHMAALLPSFGFKTLLIDADPQASAMAWHACRVRS